jgi:hypothetical protein
MSDFKTGANTHRDGCGCWECAGYREADEIADRIADDRAREQAELHEEYRRECDRERLQALAAHVAELAAENARLKAALLDIYRLTDCEVEPDDGHELCHNIWDIAYRALEAKETNA